MAKEILGYFLKEKKDLCAVGSVHGAHGRECCLTQKRKWKGTMRSWLRQQWIRMPMLRWNGTLSFVRKVIRPKLLANYTFFKETFLGLSEGNTKQHCRRHLPVDSTNHRRRRSNTKGAVGAIWWLVMKASFVTLWERKRIRRKKTRERSTPWRNRRSRGEQRREALWGGGMWVG